jgi:hypothetical protein
MRRDINLWQAAGSTLHQSDSQQVTAIVVPSGSGKVGIAAVELVAASTCLSATPAWQGRRDG